MDPCTSSRRRRSLGAARGVAALGLSAGGGAGRASTRSASPTGATHPTSSKEPPTTAPDAAKEPVPAVAASDITIRNFAFGPPAAIVKLGPTVTWRNKDEQPPNWFFASPPTRP